MNRKQSFIIIGMIILWLIPIILICFGLTKGQVNKQRIEAVRHMLETQGDRQEHIESTVALIEADERLKARDIRREQFSILLTYILVSITAVYVIITWKILRTNKDYNKISVRPLISTKLHKALNNSPLLTIRNIGLGPAKNLKIWVNGEQKRGFLPKEDKEGIIGKKHDIDSIGKEDSFILELRGRWIAGDKFAIKVTFDSMFDENFAQEETIEIPK